MKVRAKDLCNTGKVKPPALANEVKRGNLIRDEKKNFDLNNSKNREWCIRHGINPDTCKAQQKQTAVKEPVKTEIQKKEKPANKRPQTPKLETQFPLAEEEFINLTGLAAEMQKLNLNQLVFRYGGPMQLKGWVDILDKLMSAQKKDVDIQEKRKDLVPRQFVEFLKSYVNTYNSQLFDFAEGCTTEIIALIKTDSKKAKTEIPEMLRRNFSKLAAETVKRIDKEVKNLKVHNESDNE
jgi:hypothetical protein